MTTARAHSGSSRGFTLVELMVSMTAGLLVAGAAMVLARGASRTFQQEVRITSAQLATTLGMSRLAADLQRASFLSSPNVRRDPTVCQSDASFPFDDWSSVPGLGALSGISIVEGGSVSDAANGSIQQSVDNGFNPDSLVIGGSFSATEPFDTRLIQKEVAGSYTVYLAIDSGPLARARTAQGEGGEPICATVLAPNVGIFRVGRFLRIDTGEKFQYGLINDCTDTGTEVVITLAGTPKLYIEDELQCGMVGLGRHRVNPVSRVRWTLRNLRGHARYGVLVAPPADATEALMSGDGDPASQNQPGRTELVRVELDANGDEIEDRDDANPALSTLEVVAEYAVDLKFGVTSTLVNDTAPTVVRREIGNSGGYVIAQPNSDPAAFPERIRSIGVRLSTRARVPDRNQPLTGGLVGNIGRFQLTGVPGETTYARMRTLQAEIALQNQSGVAW
jgi:prepilin-type N-terminal cleavage/methylation domain-containing protein